MGQFLSFMLYCPGKLEDMRTEQVQKVLWAAIEMELCLQMMIGWIIWSVVYSWIVSCILDTSSERAICKRDCSCF